MSSQEEPTADQDFGDLFGSEEEASDIDDGRSNSPQPNQSTTQDNLFGSDEESEPESRQNLNRHVSLQINLFTRLINWTFLDHLMKNKKKKKNRVMKIQDIMNTVANIEKRKLLKLHYRCLSCHYLMVIIIK